MQVECLLLPYPVTLIYEHDGKVMPYDMTAAISIEWSDGLQPMALLSSAGKRKIINGVHGDSEKTTLIRQLFTLYPNVFKTSTANLRQIQYDPVNLGIRREDWFNNGYGMPHPKKRYTDILHAMQIGISTGPPSLWDGYARYAYTPT